MDAEPGEGLSVEPAEEDGLSVEPAELGEGSRVGSTELEKELSVELAEPTEGQSVAPGELREGCSMESAEMEEGLSMESNELGEGLSVEPAELALGPLSVENAELAERLSVDSAKLGEGLSVDSTKAGEGLSVEPVELGEGLSVEPAEPREKPSVDPAESREGLSVKSTELGEGPSVAPIDSGEDLSEDPAESGEGLGMEPVPVSDTTYQSGEGSPMQQSPDQSNHSEDYRAPEVSQVTDTSQLECQDSLRELESEIHDQEETAGNCSEEEMEHDDEAVEHVSDGDTGESFKRVDNEPAVSSGGQEELDNETKYPDNICAENEETAAESESEKKEVMSFDEEENLEPDLVVSSSDKQGCDHENIVQGETGNSSTQGFREISDSEMDYDTERVKGDEAIDSTNGSTNGSREINPVNSDISCSDSNDSDLDIRNTDTASIIEDLESRANITEVSVSGNAGPATGNDIDDELDLNEDSQVSDSDIQPAELAQNEVESSDANADCSDNKDECNLAISEDKLGEGIVEAAREYDIPVSPEQSKESDTMYTSDVISGENQEKDEGELSEASLEEVSEDDEDDKGNKGTESGIEEVSEEEDEDIKKEEERNVSGMEEVSEEESEEQIQDENKMEGNALVGNGQENSDGEISDDDIKEVGPDKRDEMSDGEVSEERNEAESGMEEVSDEEEEEGGDSGEEEGDEEEQEDGEEEGSEGMENISSEEEEEREEEADNSKETLDHTVQDGRTVEMKQNGEIVKIDDSGKEDDDIVQEILENMTIKIENVSVLERKNSEDSKERRHVRSDKDRDRSRRRKDRRESAKSKTNFSAVKSDKKDLRDINERLKAQASYGEDIELDYDDVHEETKEKAGSDSDALSSSESDEGELIEEEDCEEGEIREPGAKPFVKPTCRFFMRGHCTWGVNCRFLHPGVNDKGYYQLIERPGFNNKPPPPFEEQWEEEERSPSPEPPPAPAPEPKEETAWERGLRQAKELRKKALERREHDTNFEHKKLNLSIEENPEYNKENKVEEERPATKKKQVYYEKEVFSDDEYYDQTPVRQQQKQQQEQAWMPGQYENFEVRWARDPGYYPPPPHSNYPGPPAPAPAPGSRYPPYTEQSFRGRESRFPARRPSPKQYSPSPPPHYPSNPRYARHQQREIRMELPPRREKMRERPGSPPMPKGVPQNAMKPKADEWHDPWRRSNANKPKSPSRKRSRSRGRRRSRRSHSYSSSYSSSSYSDSSRSRSRSSSFSSVSSRSRSRSRSRSSSASSKSQVPRRNTSADRRRPPPPSFQGNRRLPPHDQPRSAVAFRGRGRGRSPEKRPGMGQLSPVKGIHKGPPMMQPRGPPGQGRSQMMDLRGGMPQGRAPVGKIADVGRKMDRGLQQQRRFQMEVKQRERPLPTSALNKDKRPSGRRRTASSSRSRSRSSSSSSRSSKSSSYSSSRSRSRSSSSSSSGSADSDHLYRNIGGNKDNQRQGPLRNRPTDKSRYKPPQDGRQKMPPKPDSKTMVIREGEFGKPMSALPQKPKDPLKVTGQKSNIKLTLIKPSEKAPGGPDQMAKKRPAEHDTGAPPAKRPSIGNQSKTAPDKLMKKADKPGPISPTKLPTKLLPSPMKAAAAPGPQAAAPAPGAKKKSTVNRREELLKQLKAVEDAIAKKKKKMT